MSSRRWPPASRTVSPLTAAAPSTLKESPGHRLVNRTVRAAPSDSRSYELEMTAPRSAAGMSSRRPCSRSSPAKRSRSIPGCCTAEARRDRHGERQVGALLGEQRDRGSPARPAPRWFSNSSSDSARVSVPSRRTSAPYNACSAAGLRRVVTTTKHPSPGNSGCT
ncbi:hypothetical protein AB0A63_38085 [Lentzea sp. NPDC042327]|uniref:hypothetical protein n=1 Tax=Lentzea sp. NPDC042327 TaxID=3154801 RepID=UPI003404B303